MANITTRYKDKSRKTIEGWQIRSNKLQGFSIRYPASIYSLGDMTKRCEILDAIEKSFAKGTAPNSDVYDDLKELNDPRFLEALGKIGVVSISRVLTLQELVERALAGFEALGDKPKTILNLKKGAQKATEYFGADCPITDISKKNARDYWTWLNSQGLKQTTIHRYISQIKQIFKWGVDNLDDDKNGLPSNPFNCLNNLGTSQTDKEKTPLTETQKERIIDALRQSDAPLFWEAWFLLGYNQGLRLRSEAPELNWEFIDLERGTILIRDVKRSKRTSLKWRPSILRSETVDALRRLKDDQKRRGIDNKGYVFPELWKIPGIEKKHDQPIVNKFKTLLKKNGISLVDPCNILRRTASNYWRETVGEYLENVFLGHSRSVARSDYYDDLNIPKNVLDKVRQSETSRELVETD